MNRRFAILGVAVFGLMLVAAGCNKSASQQPQAAADANSPAGDNSAPGRRESAPPPPPRPLVVPAESVIYVVVDQSIGSKISRSGDNFSATVERPVEIEGRVAIPRGARATGLIVDAKPAGRFKGGAGLEVTLSSVEVNGERYEVRTTSPDETTKGKGKRTAEMVGGGTGGGALIGGLAGGGKGALIGGLIGAAAGTGGAGFTGNRDIVVAPETPISFKLVEPLEIKPRRER